MLAASVIAARGRGKAARRHAAERASAKREERWPEGCRLPDAWADDPARDRLQVGGLQLRRICSILILCDSRTLDPKNPELFYLGVPSCRPDLLQVAVENGRDVGGAVALHALAAVYGSVRAVLIGAIHNDTWCEVLLNSLAMIFYRLRRRDYSTSA